LKDAVCKSFSAALWWSAEAILAAMHTFRTVAEAVATGYVLATHRVYRSYKECLIQIFAAQTRSFMAGIAA
jgi:hypothetical protein